MKKLILTFIIALIMPISALACDYCAKATVHRTDTSAYHVIPISIKTWEKGGIHYANFIMWEEHSPDAMSKRLEPFTMSDKTVAKIKAVYLQVEICLADKEYRIITTRMYDGKDVPVFIDTGMADLRWRSYRNMKYIENIAEEIEKNLK